MAYKPYSRSAFRVQTASATKRKNRQVEYHNISEFETGSKLTDHRGHEISRGSKDLPVRSINYRLIKHHSVTKKLIVKTGETNTSKLRRWKVPLKKYLLAGMKKPKGKKKTVRPIDANCSVDVNFQKNWKVTYGSNSKKNRHIRNTTPEPPQRPVNLKRLIHKLTTEQERKAQEEIEKAAKEVAKPLDLKIEDDNNVRLPGLIILGIRVSFTEIFW